MVLPPLDSYFDRDIQCLLGLHALACYLSPLNEDFQKAKETSELSFQQFFARRIYSEKCLLSMVLFSEYNEKCHYFLGGHFLARYLKVRCLLDCKKSNSEVMLEFNRMESRLPFEHMIRCFLQKRLQSSI